MLKELLLGPILCFSSFNKYANTIINIIILSIFIKVTLLPGEKLADK